MNKQLSPSEALNKVAYCYGYDKNIEIIATALKRLEELEKGLIPTANNIYHNYKLYKELKKEKEKQDKVLRIITDKEVEIGLLKGILHADKSLHTASYYNSHFVATYKHLTQAEFDLLKEYFKWI